MKNYKLPVFLVLSTGLMACSTQKGVQNTASIAPEAIVTDTLPPVIVKEPVVRAHYNPSEPIVNKLIHTKLEVSFDWTNTYLLGKATLDFEPYFYPVKEVKLDAKGFDIHKVALVVNGDMSDLKYTYNNKVITIQLNKEYKRGDRYQLFVDYTAKPNELEKGGSAAITSDIGLYFINPDGADKDKPQQIWTQGETEASSCWFPTMDTPNQKTTQEIYMTVNQKYQTLSNGILVYSSENPDGTRTDYWKQDLPHAPYLAMMAVGEFSKIQDTWTRKDGKKIEVNYYVEKEYAPYARLVFGNTPEMIQLYSDLLGVEYPWAKYDQVIVRDFVSGAMENTTAVIQGEGLYKDDRQVLDGFRESIVAHELFHHWFGDLVTCESWANIPMNESFANYGEYLWFEHKYGRDRADFEALNELQGYLSSVRNGEFKNMIRFDYAEKEDMFDRHSYNKGGRILHMLRKYLGDDAFFGEPLLLLLLG